MTQLKIYLCRHGESVFNMEKRLGGDSPLTERGIQQAHNIGDFLQKKTREFTERLQIIYHSPLQRSRQTALIVGCYFPSADRLEVPELAEIRYGSLEGCTVHEVQRRFPQQVAERKHNKLTWKLLDGESYEELGQRVYPCLEHLRKAGGIYAFITHGAVNRLIMLYFSNESERQRILNKEISSENVFCITDKTQDLFNIDIAEP